MTPPVFTDNNLIQQGFSNAQDRTRSFEKIILRFHTGTQLLIILRASMKSQKKRLKIKGPFSPKRSYQFKKAVLSFRNVVSFDDQVVQSCARDRTRSFEKKSKKIIVTTRIGKKKSQAIIFYITFVFISNYFYYNLYRRELFLLFILFHPFQKPW